MKRKKKAFFKTKDEYMLELAEAQFIGFAQGYYFTNVCGLIVSMGLTRREWELIKKKNMITQLREREIIEINNYFKEK